MAKPTEKAPAIEGLISAVAGNSRVKSIHDNVCVLCQGDASTFRDRLSCREFGISGMCQGCQDKVFGG
jgi:hypothetical protein